MSNLRAIKDKINNVKSIKKIFTVMQLIAASKMHKAQEDVNNSNKVISKIKDLVTRSTEGDASILSQFSAASHNSSKPKLYLVFCSDRGLCGNYNTILSRKVQENLSKDQNVRLIIIGNKLVTILSKRFGHLIDHEASKKFDDVRKDPTKLADLLKLVIQMNKSGEISGCDVIYVFSKSAISKKVEQVNFFDLGDLGKNSSKAILHSNEIDDSSDKDLENNLYEPGKEKVVEYLIDYFLRAKLFNIFRNAYFSELASRMLAMDSASRNSSEIERNLTIFYNKTRQATITSDLIDIINGAENV
jgi:F-type H+-transporting ATPase subunit gamma